MARGVFRVEAWAGCWGCTRRKVTASTAPRLTLSVGDGARRAGLTLSVSPCWGAPATASDALWRDHLFDRRTRGAPGGETDERALAARVDYGLQLGGLLTPFGLYGHPQYGRRLQLGLLLGPAPARWGWRCRANAMPCPTRAATTTE